jgi:hypothetical protein
MIIIRVKIKKRRETPKYNEYYIYVGFGIIDIFVFMNASR